MRIKTRDRTIADCDVGLPIGPGTGPDPAQAAAGPHLDAPPKAQRRAPKKEAAAPAAHKRVEMPVAKSRPERESRTRRRAGPGPHQPVPQSR